MANPKNYRLRCIRQLKPWWRWSFDGTDTEPGAKEPQKVTMEIGCKLAVLVTAVACTLTGSVAGFGPVEAAVIVGYSPDEKLVHWMESVRCPAITLRCNALHIQGQHPP
jgi:hypothetical protein